MNEIAKCERCREYNAAAVDFRHQATNAQNDYSALLARHNALEEALKELLDYTRACEGLLNASESGACVKARRALE